MTQQLALPGMPVLNWLLLPALTTPSLLTGYCDTDHCPHQDLTHDGFLYDDEEEIEGEYCEEFTPHTLQEAAMTYSRVRTELTAHNFGVVAHLVIKETPYGPTTRGILGFDSRKLPWILGPYLPDGLVQTAAVSLSDHMVFDLDELTVLETSPDGMGGTLTRTLTNPMESFEDERVLSTLTLITQDTRAGLKLIYTVPQDGDAWLSAWVDPERFLTYLTEAEIQAA